MAFINRLNVLMSERGINKSTLSKESGIPYTTIDGFYKKGTDNIKLSTLKKLSAYFDCSLDFLVDDENISKKPLTLTPHLDKKDFTEEQWRRIECFAKFIKQEDTANNGGKI